MLCGSVFNCHWGWDAGELTGEYDSVTGVLSFDVITDLSGTIGCPAQGRFLAEYLIDTPEDSLFAIGSQQRWGTANGGMT